MPKRYTITLITVACALCAYIAAVMFQRYGFAVLVVLVPAFGAAAYALGRARLSRRPHGSSHPS